MRTESQCATETAPTMREVLKRMWIDVGMDLNEIDRENAIADIAYKLMDKGRTNEDIDEEFSKLTYDEIVDKYGYLLK